MTICQDNMTKGNEDVTKDDKPADRFTQVFNRIFKPESESDHDLLWTAVIAFILGAVIF